MPSSDPRAVRRTLAVRVFRLDDEPGDDLSAITTPEQRLEMVAALSRRMWELTGRPFPSYACADVPGRVIRPT